MLLDVGDLDGHLGTLADLIARYQHEGLRQRSERVTGRARCGERRGRRMATPIARRLRSRRPAAATPRSHRPAVSGARGAAVRAARTSRRSLPRRRPWLSARHRACTRRRERARPQAGPLRGSMSCMRSNDSPASAAASSANRALPKISLSSSSPAPRRVTTARASPRARSPRARRPAGLLLSRVDGRRSTKAPWSAEAPHEVPDQLDRGRTGSMHIIEREYDQMTPGRGPAAPDRILGPLALRVDRAGSLIGACLENDGKIEASTASASA